MSACLECHLACSRGSMPNLPPCRVNATHTYILVPQREFTYLPAFIFSFQSHRGEQLTLTTDAEDITTVSGLNGEVANFTKADAAVITVDGDQDKVARGHIHIIDLVFVPRRSNTATLTGVFAWASAMLIPSLLILSHLISFVLLPCHTSKRQ